MKKEPATWVLMNKNSTFLKLFAIPAIATVLSISGCENSAINNSSGFDIKTIITGKGPGSVEVADFNKDGFADIALANTKDSSISILLGNGKGEFTASPGSPFFANRSPDDIVVADFNKDENLDLGIANTEVSELTILLGNGKGQFQQAAKSPFIVHSIPHTHGIATGDFNGDGNMDLATDSWGENKVVIIFGDGQGNFGGQMSYPVGNRPYQRLRAADLNKDGKPDIVTSNLEGNNATVLLSEGEGKFQEAPGSPFPAGDAPFGITIGDINADNNQDIAIVNSPTITAESKGKDGLYLLMGDGSGKFHTLKGSPFTTGKSPSRLAIGDLNGDGINDIAVTNYNDKSISIFYMNKNGVDRSILINVGGHPDGIAIHDLNGDGRNDIAVSNIDDNNLMILFQK